jgi:hypothetical protein
MLLHNKYIIMLFKNVKWHNTIYTVKCNKINYTQFLFSDSAVRSINHEMTYICLQSEVGQHQNLMRWEEDHDSLV